MPCALSRRLYIQRILDLYRLAPGTTGHIRRTDRQLAEAFHDRNISLEIVHASLILAVARRTFRSGEPLTPIATLHYIRPLIEELLAEPPDPAYVNYIRHKLAAVAPEFAAAADHQLP